MRLPTLLVILALLISPLASAGVAPAGGEPQLRLHRAILGLVKKQLRVLLWLDASRKSSHQPPDLARPSGSGGSGESADLFFDKP